MVGWASTRRTAGLALAIALAACVALDDDDSAAADDDDSAGPCVDDADGDGFTSSECGGPDCDDAAADVNPDQSEICADGIDNDCDGTWIGCGLFGVVGPGAATWVVEGGENSGGFGRVISVESGPDSASTPNLVVQTGGSWGSREVAWYEFDHGFSLRGSLVRDGTGPGQVRWLDVVGAGEYLVVTDAWEKGPTFGEFGSAVEVASFQSSDLAMTESRIARLELVTGYL